MRGATFWLWWLLVPLLGACGFWVGVGVGLAVYMLAFKLCPASAIVSGMCVAPWFTAAATFSFVLGPMVGAAWTVAVPAWIAPRHRGRVAWVMYALGALYTVGVVLEPFVRRPERGLVPSLEMLGIPASSALVAGAGVAYALSRRWSAPRAPR